MERSEAARGGRMRAIHGGHCILRVLFYFIKVYPLFLLFFFIAAW